MIDTAGHYAPFSPGFTLSHRHGLVRGVYLPLGREPPDESVLDRLHSAERRHAEGLPPRRHAQFVGGRVAMRALLEERGIGSWAVLPGHGGAPGLPPGYAGSISHTRGLAVAILCPGSHGVGIDVEDLTRQCRDIGRHILCDDEREAVAGLTDLCRWRETLLRFSLKESLYKALNPLIDRWIGFRDLAVWPSADGSARIDARSEGLSTFSLEGAWLQIERWILSIATVRADDGMATRVQKPTNG